MLRTIRQIIAVYSALRRGRPGSYSLPGGAIEISFGEADAIPFGFDPEDVKAPHCDALVLHAPGECFYCDKYPARQAQRERLSINFTGHDDPEKDRCPSEARRPLATINRWPGNTPKPAGQPYTDWHGMEMPPPDA